MMAEVDRVAYYGVEFLSADPVRDAETSEPRVGLTFDSDGAVAMCVSLNDAATLLRQLRAALDEFAEGGEYPDAD